MQEYRNLQERTNEDLVIEYQTTHNEDLFRALLEKNTGLLHIIVMDYRIPKYEIEDLLSESYIALIKAVDNFDPTRGVTFTTALIRIMESLILTMQSVRSWVLRIQTAYTLGISLERERITMRLRWRMRMLLRVLELILHPEMIIL